LSLRNACKEINTTNLHRLLAVNGTMVGRQQHTLQHDYNGSGSSTSTSTYNKEGSNTPCKVNAIRGGSNTPCKAMDELTNVAHATHKKCLKANKVG